MATNSKDIFDQVEYSPYGDIFEQVEYEEAPISRFKALQKKTLSESRQVAKHAAIGAAKGGLGAYGDILQLLGIQPEEQPPEEKAKFGEEFEILERLQQPGYKPTLAEVMTLTEDPIAPPVGRLPGGQDIERLAQMLGIETEPQTAPQRYAQSIAEAGGAGASLAANPLAILAMMGGAAAGQTARELGAPEGLATGIDIGTSLATPGFKKALVPGKKLKELVNFGRAAKLTEKELTPLLKKESSLAVLSKLFGKGPKLKESFKSIGRKLGDVYDSIHEKAGKFPMLSLEQDEKLLDDFGKINKKLRTTIKASPEKKAATSFIEDAMSNIRNTGSSPEELTRFVGDINAAVDWNKIKGGKKVLAGLKKPVMEVLESVDPQLAKEFDLTNQLWRRYKTAEKVLKPHIADRFKIAGRIVAAGAAIGTLNPALLKGVASEVALSHLSKELATNPRMQNIWRKIGMAVKNNKRASALQLERGAHNILSKKYPQENWDFLIGEDTNNEESNTKNKPS